MIVKLLFSTIGNIIRGYFNLLRFKISPKFKKKQSSLFYYRLSTCETCESLNKTVRQCTLCGCFVDAKTKVIYKTDDEGFAVCRIDKKTGDIYYACPKRLW
jgi:hypothetical protein